MLVICPPPLNRNVKSPDLTYLFSWLETIIWGLGLESLGLVNLCRANGGVKIPPKPLFSLPFRNRLELTEKLLWLFLKMTGLQDGINRKSVAPTRWPIWRLQTGSSEQNLSTVYACTLSSVVHWWEANYQRLPPHYRQKTFYWCYSLYYQEK